MHIQVPLLHSHFQPTGEHVNLLVDLLSEKLRLSGPRLVAATLVLIIGFSVMDGMRDTFLQGSPLSYSKELLLIWGCFILFILHPRKAITFKRPFILTVAGLTYLLSSIIITTHFLDEEIAEYGHLQSNLSFGGWSIVIKVFALLFFCLFINTLKSTYPRMYRKIPSLYCRWAIIYCLTTIFFTTTGLADRLPQRCWYGRLSIGYPTMDAIILMTAIIFATFSNAKALHKSLSITLYIVVIIMQNTASGYMAIGIYCIILAYHLPLKWKIAPISLMGISITGLWAVYTYAHQYMGVFGGIIVDKINGFIFGQDTSSISARLTQIQNLNNDILSTPIGIIFGGGGSASYYVESQYYTILGAWGGIGIAFFAIFYLFYTLDSMIDRNQTSRVSRIALIATFMIGAIPLGGINLFPFLFHLAYMSSQIGERNSSPTHSENIR